MANTLNIDLHHKVVIISAVGLRPEYAPEERRRFLATGGFGEHAGLVGGLLMGIWLEDGTRDSFRYPRLEKLADEQLTDEEIAALTARTK